MKKCVILTMQDPTDYIIYDQLLERPLAEAGWHCETIAWNANNVDWNDYDLVMIRSTWDYQLHSDAFLEVLQEIEDSNAQLDNSLEIVRWNINKTYLRELAGKGIEIVPTIWLQSIQADQISQFFEQLNTAEIIIKPCVSAGAFDTYRINTHQVAAISAEIVNKFTDRQCMVQPFLNAIVEEGEFSVFYFDDHYSHAILKTPKAEDFRVQEEYGGRLLSIEPEPLLKQQAEKVLKAIGSSLLYARLDFVRTSTGFALMEAELIEPSLYFNLDPQSPRRYVEAIERRLVRKTKKANST